MIPVYSPRNPLRRRDLYVHKRSGLSLSINLSTHASSSYTYIDIKNTIRRDSLLKRQIITNINPDYHRLMRHPCPWLIKGFSLSLSSFIYRALSTCLIDLTIQNLDFFPRTYENWHKQTQFTLSGFYVSPSGSVGGLSSLFVGLSVVHCSCT